MFCFIRIIMITATLLAVTPCFAAWNHISDNKDLKLNHHLQQLTSALVTRPEVTSDTDRKALHPAILAGAEAFADVFRHDKRLHQFSRDLRPLLAAYNSKMAGAAAGVDGAEARGEALSRLLAGIIDVAKQDKIDLELVDMAFLQAAAAIEKIIQRPPAAKVLALEDRELVFLLLLNSTYQVHKRIVTLKEPLAALLVLGTDPALMTSYAQRFIWSEPAFTKELIRLELNLSDPNNFRDLNRLFTMQFNEEAQIDLLFFKFAMEAYFFSSRVDFITQITANMASMGGIMANMTAKRLQESGLLIDDSFLTWAAYNWVTPATSLGYVPDSNLSRELTLLGATVPSPPDFSLVTSPYRDIFQLSYDLSLCDQISSKEWWIADDRNVVLNNHPLSMSERLELRRADVARRQTVMAKLSGVTAQEKRALRILLSRYPGK